MGGEVRPHQIGVVSAPPPWERLFLLWNMDLALSRRGSGTATLGTLPQHAPCPKQPHCIGTVTPSEKTARRQLTHVLHGLPESGWRGFLLPPVRPVLADRGGGSGPPGTPVLSTPGAWEMLRP